MRQVLRPINPRVDGGGDADALPEIELSLIIRRPKGRGALKDLLQRIDSSLPRTPWEAIIVGNSPETSFALGRPAQALNCKRLLYLAEHMSPTGVPIDKLLAPTSTCIAVMEEERFGRSQLLPGMLNLLQADDADLVIAYRRGAEGSIDAPPEDTDFAARLAKTLIRLSHAEWRQLPSWQVLLRRQLLDHVRGLSGQSFGAFLELLRSGDAPWRIIELPLPA